MNLYKTFIKPIFFRLDPETTHTIVLTLGILATKFHLTPLLGLIFKYENKKLNITVDGIRYKNPLGLAAGFDKDAQLIHFFPYMGFGHEECGSITARPYGGNPKPRLWRLIPHNSLIIYYGLKNRGAKAIARYLKKPRFPLGISIAKTNCKETVDTDNAIADYYESLQILEPFADYLTINISCPNAFGGQPFTDQTRLNKLLAKLDEHPSKKPRYIKVSPDLTKKQVDDLLDVAQQHKVNGFICCNLVKKRETTNIPKEDFPTDKGGLSGAPVRKPSTDMIRYIYKKTRGKFTLIGCGGIFTAEDAYEKIKAGASLLQMITGMIFNGPTTMKEINKGLVELLEKDGYESIQEAVGKDHNSKSR